MEGMLLQEYVTDMLEVRIPEGWEESVREAYSQDPGGNPDGDDDNADNMDVDDQGETEDVEPTHGRSPQKHIPQRGVSLRMI
jgi:hypothetical protein